MADPAVAQTLIQQYPWIQALLGIPEVSQLILESVDPNVGFSPETFEAKLYQTEWWRTTPESARQAFIKASIDPATYAQARGTQHVSLADWAQRLGVNLTPEEMLYISESMTQKGQDIEGTEAQVMLRNWLRGHMDRITPGQPVDLTAKQLQGIAQGEYFVSLADSSAQWHAINLLTGEFDEETTRAGFAEMAKAQYKHLADRLSKGETMADIVNPLRQIAADELEVKLEAIDPRSAQWSFMLGMPGADDPTGMRLPTYSEVQTQARRDQRWWKTSKGRQSDASMASTLLAAFGKRAI